MPGIEGLKQAATFSDAGEAQFIVNSIPGFVAIYGPGGEFLGLNEQFLQYLGQSLEEFRAWATNGTIAPTDLARHVSEFESSLGLGRVRSISKLVLSVMMEPIDGSKFAAIPVWAAKAK